MSTFQDPFYLAINQYKDTGNLNTRIQLHKRYSTNPYGWFRWVFDHFDFPPEAHVLELGCGSGALWSENLTRIPHDWRITLSDLSPGMVSSCKAIFSTNPGQFALSALDATALPFGKSKFDAVIANHMLYHLPNLPRTLTEIVRVLKPTGCLYAATNGKSHLLELDLLIEQHLSLEDSGLLSGECSRYFTLENGASQLTPWFKQVETLLYTDSLEVTEAEPLIAYIHSMIPRNQDQAGSYELLELSRSIKGLIQQEGCIHIQKASGMFVASK
jgi:ubiquinone/menaquinone biosynthesis C-methylase UbiE